MNPKKIKLTSGIYSITTINTPPLPNNKVLESFDLFHKDITSLFPVVYKDKNIELFLEKYNRKELFGFHSTILGNYSYIRENGLQSASASGRDFEILEFDEEWNPEESDWTPDWFEEEVIHINFAREHCIYYWNDFSEAIEHSIYNIYRNYETMKDAIPLIIVFEISENEIAFVEPDWELHYEGYIENKDKPISYTLESDKIEFTKVVCLCKPTDTLLNDYKKNGLSIGDVFEKTYTLSADDMTDLEQRLNMQIHDLMNWVCYCKK